MNAPTLKGERVTLRALRPEDEASRLALGWHAEVERDFGQEHATRDMTMDEARTWFETQQRHASDPTRLSWVIELAGTLVGVAHLHSLNDTDRKARFVIRMFSPDHVGHGLGTEAGRLVLFHAFETLDLHRVDLRVLAFNHRAVASYRKCGFVEEGRERESCWLDGQWHDDIIMGILRPEFLLAA